MVWVLFFHPLPAFTQEKRTLIPCSLESREPELAEGKMALKCPVSSPRSHHVLDLMLCSTDIIFV